MAYNEYSLERKGKAMTHFTESMMGLQVTSNGIEYTLTGYRYFDYVNFLYWYETTGEVWLLGDSMKSRGME